RARGAQGRWVSERIETVGSDPPPATNGAFRGGPSGGRGGGRGGGGWRDLDRWRGGEGYLDGGRYGGGFSSSRGYNSAEGRGRGRGRGGRGGWGDRYQGQGSFEEGAEGMDVDGGLDAGGGAAGVAGGGGGGPKGEIRPEFVNPDPQHIPRSARFFLVRTCMLALIPKRGGYGRGCSTWGPKPGDSSFDFEDDGKGRREEGRGRERKRDREEERAGEREGERGRNGSRGKERGRERGGEERERERKGKRGRYEDERERGAEKSERGAETNERGGKGEERWGHDKFEEGRKDVEGGGRRDAISKRRSFVVVTKGEKDDAAADSAAAGGADGTGVNSDRYVGDRPTLAGQDREKKEREREREREKDKEREQRRSDRADRGRERGERARDWVEETAKYRGHYYYGRDQAYPAGLGDTRRDRTYPGSADSRRDGNRTNVESGRRGPAPLGDGWRDEEQPVRVRSFKREGGKGEDRWQHDKFGDVAKSPTPPPNTVGVGAGGGGGVGADAGGPDISRIEALLAS
ncbi:unnamed protein product, partial [Closterium sp. NIES-54]